jgi:hypothetical protein
MLQRMIEGHKTIVPILQVGSQKSWYYTGNVAMEDKT